MSSEKKTFVFGLLIP